MRAVELFPCSGGIAAGFRAAGIEFEMAYEIEKEHCDSYELNLGHRPIQMDVRDLLRMLKSGVKLGPVDLLTADPPCTPWSQAGLGMGEDDERDMMAETVEIIMLVRPRCYLIGNVPGLEKAPHWGTLQKLLAPLGKAGYCIRDFAVLDAAAYGVPQRRLRPWWFGHLDGECIRWPEPTHGDPRKSAGLPGVGLRPWVTVRDAIGHITGPELGRLVGLRKRNQNSKQHGSVTDAPARVVGTSNLSDGNVLVTTSKHPASPMDGPAHTIRAGGGGGVRDGSVVELAPREDGEYRNSEPDAPARTMPSTTVTTKEDRVGSGAVVIPWPWDVPSTTVMARPGLAPPGHHPEEGSIMSMPGAVVISERAAAILQGFPDGECAAVIYPDGVALRWLGHGLATIGGTRPQCDALMHPAKPGETCPGCGRTRRWHLLGETKKSRWGQLGMAMPPAFAAAVGRSVVKWFADNEGAPSVSELRWQERREDAK